MGRYLSGAALGFGLLLLLGAGGDSGTLDSRVAELEKLARVQKGEIHSIQSKLNLLDSKLSALEKKLAEGGQATQPAADRAEAPPNDAKQPAKAPGEFKLPELDEPGPVVVDEKKIALERRIKALRTAQYVPVERIDGLWVSPIKTGAIDKQGLMTGTGQLLYIGEEDFAGKVLTLQVVQQDKSGKPLGDGRAYVFGRMLKPDKPHAFHFELQLRERPGLTDTILCRYAGTMTEEDYNRRLPSSSR